jgi:hypothetical protein
MGSAFTQWTRSLGAGFTSKSCDCQDIDHTWPHRCIWNRHLSHWFIVIEEKSHGGTQSAAQDDTHAILDQMLRFASDQQCEVECGIGDKRQRRRVEYRGYYLIVFEKFGPLDSSWVTINGRKFTDAEHALQYLLLHGKLP